MRPLSAGVLCAALILVGGSSAAETSPRSVNVWAAGDHAVGTLIFRWNSPKPPKPRPRPTTRISSQTQYGFHGSATGTVNGYPCGGSLPPCYVLARESGGNPTARNPRSTASGLWQFLDSTWAGYAGYARAYLAPPSVQNEKARLVWANGAGCRHWSAC